MIRLRVSLALAALASAAVLVHAQAPAKPSPLVGTWTLVLVDNVLKDGTRVHLYGDPPAGLLVFDEKGRYSLQIVKPGRRPFASSDKGEGTPDEYKMAVMGCNSHFGRYVVNPDGKSMLFKIEYASFPNWEGTQQKRSFTLTANELKYVVPIPTSGADQTGEVVWRRAE